MKSEEIFLVFEDRIHIVHLRIFFQRRFRNLRNHKHHICMNIEYLLHKLFCVLQFSKMLTFFHFFKMEEMVGFEPTVPFRTTVFKTVALNHSATFPSTSNGNRTRIAGVKIQNPNL